jgi:tRNA1(Val) A37 N6-methylase TrmN6
MEEQYLYTEDRLLGGSVVLRQPMQGFRAAIDPVLLAAAVPAAAGERVLELGAGTGAAALCLARRVAGVESIGLDIQPDLVALANANALANGLAGSARFMVGDVAHLPAELLAVRFDHVMANPPYLPTGSATLPANAARALAVGERAGAELPVWIDAAPSPSSIGPTGWMRF